MSQWNVKKKIYLKIIIIIIRGVEEGEVKEEAEEVKVMAEEEVDTALRRALSL